MLPDLAKVKSRANRDILRWVRQQIPVVTPLIQGVATFRQHEGRVGRMIRTDDSEASIDYHQSEFRFELNRDEMLQFNLQSIRQKLMELARKVGEAQSKRMLEVAGEAADSVGNVVHAGGELTALKFLEVIRRVQMDFDPNTLEPAPGFVWVMHPDTAASVVPKVKEWEKDPEFKAHYEQVMGVKREEWRDREANRKLVD
jgi:hypothetical protein